MGRKHRPPQIILQPKAVDMIEHTITKYKHLPAPISYLPSARQPLTQITNHKTIWGHQKSKEYLEELTKRGLIIGAEITTTYGHPGTISSIKEIPLEGYTIFGTGFPNIFTIIRPLMGDSGVYYNEAELKLNNK